MDNIPKIVVDTSTTKCKIVPANFTNASYISDEHHFKRVTIEDYNNPIDESIIIDEYSDIKSGE